MKTEELTPEHLKDGWLMIANHRNQDRLEIWDGHGWTYHFGDGWRAKDEENLKEEAIRLESEYPADLLDSLARAGGRNATDVENHGEQAARAEE